MPDVVAELGGVFLGARLRRLAERLQADAAQVIAEAGIDAQPSHMPLLAALDREAMTVGRLAEALGASQPGVTRGLNQLQASGLVETRDGEDARARLVALTPAGEAAMAKVRARVWPPVSRAVDALCGGDAGPLLDRLAALEAAMAERSLLARVREDRPKLAIVEYREDLAAAFHDINREWIEAMFTMEGADRDVIERPRETILDPGGAILFVAAEGLGIVGTCALRAGGDNAFELTKMGVLEAARGLKAGEFLLEAAIARAQALGADPLYLLTNARCEAAIHLYEKLGFRHDAQIMERYGARYERCDVAMRFVPDTPPRQ
ncbi:MarR family transcriptional regulator [Novosphingobium sp. PC22D]|uniref:bifunctional helix-turn-helix transcriptional regulator/GNAT family N-acetyltransferase n=1 Tax=Novosphingobium sp. PC22D TaxID=1962403 RepID=UPI000BEF9F16|nr:bifunctional helix-turn-helix transcriptional regulator/GNAT family N-acetyltransferase [Novosphingobium sp. PC22D]PEQ14191.1 MarR family transcriptional regulator [Novosphingobium sp. PC22D]